MNRIEELRIRVELGEFTIAEAEREIRRRRHGQLSPGLLRSALRLAGARPEHWLCPVCGDVVADDELPLGLPIHQHRGRRVELVPRAEL